MAKSMNSPEQIAKRQEENREKMRKGGLPPSPVDPARVANIKEFNEDPQKFFEKMYINQQYQSRDKELWLYLLLSKIEAKLP